jgi:alcohol dehydrogenase class IV
MEKSFRDCSAIEMDKTNHSSLTPFEHQARTRIVFGEGSVDRTGELAAEIGARRVLVVTDSGIVKAGHAGHVQKSVEAAGLSVAVYDGVNENPATSDVDRCVEAARESKCDLIIGLGGGSSMDTAKGCNFIFTNGGRMQDYSGVGMATKPMLPFIAIPTTAGTGSECQSAALIADAVTHMKMACLDPKAAARAAILDPALTLSQPSGVTVCTGIDAIAHAVETAVTKKRNPFSLMYSREAFRLCISAFPEVVANPGDVAARGRMLLGASFAGVAIEHSMLGAAHAAANPLTAMFGVVHGQAVGMLLPHVVRFNGQVAIAREGYLELARAAGISGSADSDERTLALLIEQLETVLRLAGFPGSLSDCGVKCESIPSLANEAAGQWTAAFNPREASRADFVKLYEAAL